MCKVVCIDDTIEEHYAKEQDQSLSQSAFDDDLCFLPEAGTEILLASDLDLL